MSILNRTVFGEVFHSAHYNFAWSIALNNFQSPSVFFQMLMYFAEFWMPVLDVEVKVPTSNATFSDNSSMVVGVLSMSMPVGATFS